MYHHCCACVCACVFGGSLHRWSKYAINNKRKVLKDKCPLIVEINFITTLLYVKMKTCSSLWINGHMLLGIPE